MVVTLPGNACRTISGWSLALFVHFARTIFVQQFVLVLVNKVSHLHRASYRSKPKETLTLTWCMDVALIFTRGKGIHCLSTKWQDISAAAFQMPGKRVEAVPRQVLNVRLPVNVSTEAPTRKYSHQPHSSVKPITNCRVKVRRGL